jgi:hypothetical protein
MFFHLLTVALGMFQFGKQLNFINHINRIPHYYMGNIIKLNPSPAMLE